MRQKSLAVARVGRPYRLYPKASARSTFRSRKENDFPEQVQSPIHAIVTPGASIHP